MDRLNPLLVGFHPARDVRASADQGHDVDRAEQGVLYCIHLYTQSVQEVRPRGRAVQVLAFEVRNQLAQRVWLGHSSPQADRLDFEDCKFVEIGLHKSITPVDVEFAEVLPVERKSVFICQLIEVRWFSNMEGFPSEVVVCLYTQLQVCVVNYFPV